MRNRIVNRSCAFLLIGVLASSAVVMGYSEARTVKAFDFVVTPAIAYEVIATLLAACGITIGGIAFAENKDAIADSILEHAETEYNLNREKLQQQGVAMNEFTDFIGEAYEKGSITVDSAVAGFIEGLVDHFSYSTAIPDYSILDHTSSFLDDNYRYYIIFKVASSTYSYVSYFADVPLLCYGNAMLPRIYFTFKEGFPGNMKFCTMDSSGNVVDSGNASGSSKPSSDFLYSNCPVYSTYADVPVDYPGVFSPSNFVDFDPLGMIQKKLEELETKLSDLNFGSVNDAGELTNDIPIVDPQVWADVADDVITWDDAIADNKIVVWDPVTDMPVVGELPDVIDPDKPVDPDPENPGNPDTPGSGFDKTGLTVDLSKLFPFCIPFDLVRAIKVFNQEPETPRVEWTLNITPLDYSYTFVIDLETFDSVAVVFRTMFLILFIVGLIMATRALIKG